VERPTVVIELGEHPELAREISAGGVFVPACELRLNSDCTLLVRGPEEEIELAARVVYLDLEKGAGLELVGFTPALREHLTRLMTAWVATVDAPPPPSSDDDLAVDVERVEAATDHDEIEHAEADHEMEAAVADGDAAEEPLDLGFEPANDLTNDTTNDPASDPASDPSNADEPPLSEDEKADPVKRRHALNLHERLRGLTLAQQVKVAQTGDPQERILLERYYNKNVWEPLLRNPRLTPPEVARIARMGTLPRVMLEIIVNNGGWLQVPEIRRALLANPRLGTDQVLRVLRMLPKHELKLASTQTAYPYAVRDAAKRLIKDHVGG